MRVSPSEAGRDILQEPKPIPQQLLPAMCQQAAESGC